MTSEWPPRYFVVECTTKSAPSSSGRWLTGVANVLSTATIAPPPASHDARDVDDVQQRVGRRLDPDQPRLVAHRGGDGVEVGLVDEGVAQAPARQDLVDEPVRAAVEVVRQHDVVARRADRGETAWVAAMPRGERRGVAALELASACSSACGSGWRPARTRSSRRSRRPRLGVGRGLVDRRDDRAVVRVGLEAGVDGAGGEALAVLGSPWCSSGQGLQQVGAGQDAGGAPVARRPAGPGGRPRAARPPRGPGRSPRRRGRAAPSRRRSPRRAASASVDGVLAAGRARRPSRRPSTGRGADDRQLRDAVLVQQRDRVADLLVRLDRHERRHVAGLALGAAARRRRSGRRAGRGSRSRVIQASLKILRQVGAPAVREDHRDQRLGVVDLARDLERGEQRRAARAAGEDALGPSPAGAS